MNNPTDWIGWMPSRDELTSAAEADEVDLLEAGIIRLKAANARLTRERDDWRQAAKVEASLRREFHDEAERLREELRKANRPVRGPGPD